MAKKISKQLTITVYERAIKLIEKGWTQERYARDKNNEHVHYTSPDACQFCSIGSLCRAYYDVTGKEMTTHGNSYSGITKPLRSSLSDGLIVLFNDGQKTTKIQVLDLFRKTLKGLEGKKAA